MKREGFKTVAATAFSLAILIALLFPLTETGQANPPVSISYRRWLSESTQIQHDQRKRRRWYCGWGSWRAQSQGTISEPFVLNLRTLRM